MRPFYDDGTVNVCNANCLEALPALESSGLRVDLVLTDPPYGISRHTVIRRGPHTRFQGGDIVLYFGPWDEFSNEEEYWGFTAAWVRAADRLLRPGGIFCSFFDRAKVNFLSAYLARELGYKEKGYFLWIKSNPTPQVRRAKLMVAWEVCGIWQKPGGPLTFNWWLGQHPDYLILPTNADGPRLHRTQKPLRLCEVLVSYWTRPGDTVLDPFLGSSTTAAAAKRLGRRCVGVEVSVEYCRVAADRCRQGVFAFAPEGFSP